MENILGVENLIMSITYKSKPGEPAHTIEAFQWTGNPNAESLPNWFLRAVENKEIRFTYHWIYPQLEFITKYSGSVPWIADIGDWITYNKGIIVPRREQYFRKHYIVEDEFDYTKVPIPQVPPFPPEPVDQETHMSGGTGLPFPVPAGFCQHCGHRLLTDEEKLAALDAPEAEDY